MTEQDYINVSNYTRLKTAYQILQDNIACRDTLVILNLLQDKIAKLDKKIELEATEADKETLLLWPATQHDLMNP